MSDTDDEHASNIFRILLFSSVGFFWMLRNGWKGSEWRMSRRSVNFSEEIIIRNEQVQLLHGFWCFSIAPRWSYKTFHLIRSGFILPLALLSNFNKNLKLLRFELLWEAFKVLNRLNSLSDHIYHPKNSYKTMFFWKFLLNTRNFLQKTKKLPIQIPNTRQLPNSHVSQTLKLP